jgi:HEXXH motif-containing protein
MPELDLRTHSVPLVPRDALLFRDHDHIVGSAVADIEADNASVLVEALRLIREFAPIYFPWIERSIHHIFLLEPRPSILESGTIEQYPGIIHLSACDRPTPLAELLVHEASHLHAYTLSRLGPLQDGSDTRVYFSPPVKAYRRLSLIAIAYHAFANIVLFYRTCMEAGIPQHRYCAQEERKIVELLGPLQAPLVDNPALTTIGRSLCAPLMERVSLG